MRVDVYCMYGGDVACASSKGTPMLIVPEGTEPEEIPGLEGRNITFKKYRTSMELEEDDKRIALDSKKALQDLDKNGYHATVVAISPLES